MIPHNGHKTSTTILSERDGEQIKTPPAAPSPVAQPAEITTRTKLRSRQQFQQNRFVIIGAGAFVIALLVFVATSIPHKVTAKKPQVGPGSSRQESRQITNASPDQSLFPVTDSGRPSAKETHEGFLDEKDLERSATRQSRPTAITTAVPNAPGTLGSIPPFGPDQPSWQAPPYTTVGSPTATNSGDPGRTEREALEKSAFIYVRSASATPANAQSRERLNVMPEITLGLITGTRLRARMVSAASTAVRAPVMAVIDYTYEQDGQIIVPAGAKVVGHIQEADRSGYVRVQFESLIMPDGATVSIQATAMDLDMGALKGKVEGKNTGKNILVRSLSGIGEAGAVLLGRGSLNQPLSELDLIRERVSNNIGEASDEEISRMGVTSHIVVTVAANTPIYVVFEQAPKPELSPEQRNSRDVQSLNTNTQELQQLMQLQRELKAANSTSQ